MSIQDLETKAAAEVAKAELWFKSNKTIGIAIVVASFAGFVLGKIF